MDFCVRCTECLKEFLDLLRCKLKMTLLAQFIFTLLRYSGLFLLAHFLKMLYGTEIRQGASRFIFSAVF